MQVEKISPNVTALVRYVEEPVFIVTNGRQWIWAGDKDGWFSYLAELYRDSAKHRAVIDGKVSRMVGNGIRYRPVEGEDKESLTYAQLFMNPHPDSAAEPLGVVARRIAKDYELYGGFSDEAIDDESGTRVYGLRHVDFGRLRQVEDNDEIFYYSRNFSLRKSDKKRGRPKAIKSRFTELSRFGVERANAGVTYYVDYQPDMQFYPYPGYVGALNYIAADAELSKFHLSNINTGFSAGHMLIVQGVSEKNQKKYEEFVQKFKKKFQDAENAGDIVHYQAPDGVTATLLPLDPGSLADKFNSVGEKIEQEIFSGHRVTSPMLFGVKTEGQLGGRSELRTAFELFDKSYVEDRREIILAHINQLASRAGIKGEFYFEVSTPVTEEPPSMQEVLGVVTAVKSELIEPESAKVLLQKIGGMSEDDASALIDRLEVEEDIPVQQESELEKAQRFTAMAAEPGIAFDSPEFDKLGKHFSEVSFLYADRENSIPNGETPEAWDAHTKATIAKFQANEGVDETDREILSILEKEPDAEAPKIAEALGVPTPEVVKRLADLEADGYLSVRGGKRTPKEKGRRVAAKTEIRYRYEKWQRVPGPILIKTSRPFCVKLVTSGNLYTRDEINLMRNGQGLSVWGSRGGHYGKLKRCRHVWVPYVVEVE